MAEDVRAANISADTNSAVATIPSTVPYTPTHQNQNSSSSSSSRRGSSKSTKTLRRNFSFLDDGARTVLAPIECGFPVPKRGQSLCEFLSSADFNTHMSPLDKENAHFWIAEALIQAIEHFNYTVGFRRPNQRQTSESEVESVPNVTLKPRRKRRDKKVVGAPGDSTGTPGTTDYATSLSPGSSEVGDEAAASDCSIESEGSQAPLSAEGVALCLLRSFKDKPLPKASDLTWVIKENDEVPQELIPLPDSWPVSPDESSQFGTRGSEYWAPPRKQIIYNKIFREGSAKEGLKQQNYRCAGCSMRMMPNSRLRLCHYLGKYFCQLCHRNMKSMVPARIVLKWDFSQFPVSNFAKELLESLYCDPVFDLFEFTRTVSNKSRTLSKVTDLRGALKAAAQYVLLCKNANKDRLLSIADYLYLDPYKYSLNDFVQARSGELLKALLESYQRCVSHIQTCQHCHDQGYFCELCRKNEVIFPFDKDHVIQCGACRACFHKNCVKGGFICKKCERLHNSRCCQTDYIDLH